MKPKSRRPQLVNVIEVNLSVLIEPIIPLLGFMASATTDSVGLSCVGNTSKTTVYF